MNELKKSTKNNKLVLMIQEAERQRIARDLHDITLQDLTHIVHQLELFGLYIQKDPLKANIELLSIKQGIKTAIDDVRDIIFDLRPMTFDDLGLKETLEAFFQNLKNTSKIEFITDIDDIESNEQIVLLNIYRIIVECVLNAVKHSKGTHIICKCKNNGDFCSILVEDNGVGFSKDDVLIKKNHFGLSVMNERVTMLDGVIKFETKVNEGTKIFIRIPL